MEMYKNQNQVFTDVISLNTQEILSRKNELVLASKNGLTVQCKKEFLNLSKKEISKFLNKPVELFLSQYELTFYGVIRSIKNKGDDLIETQVCFMENTPFYYRECVSELLN